MADITNVDIVLYSLYRLGGAEHSVHTEDIALECFRLVPTRFSWKKYPQYPESEPAREALFDARRERFGGLVRRMDKDVHNLMRHPNSRMEWMLTPDGIDYVKARMKQLDEPITDVPAQSTTRQSTQRLLSEMEKHAAFRKFRSTGNCKTIKPYEFTDFLRCTLDSSPAKIRERFQALKTRAHDAQRIEILTFLDACEQRFTELLGGSEPPQS